MVIALLIFLIFLGICVIFLIIFNCVVGKFLHGDYTKVSEDDGKYTDDDDKIEVSPSYTAPYKEYKTSSALEMIKETGFKGTFMRKAIVKMSLQYLKHSSCIVGNVRTVENLDFLDKYAPDDVHFRLKLVPSEKFTAKTSAKSARSRVLALSYTIGPVSLDILTTNQLRLRLYGKRPQKLARWKAYGECFVDLKNLLYSDESIDITKEMLPLAQKRINRTSQTLSSDEDIEESTEVMEADRKKENPSIVIETEAEKDGIF